MKTHELRTLLTHNPELSLRLMLPHGSVVPVSFHITEVGRIQKSFIDCGGTRHDSLTCQLQAWVGEDEDHRLSALKLAGILGKASAEFGDDDLPVEIEYEDNVISQYPLSRVTRENGALVLHLTTKHTDCLAKELCGLPASGDDKSSCDTESSTSCCGSSGGCCG